LKCNIDKYNINITNGKHHEWFLAFLLPHPRVALSQQNIETHADSLEIVMRLYKTSIQYDTLGVQKIHAELQNLCLELQSLKKDRTARPKVREEVWFLKCKSQGHDNDHCPLFMNYVVGGGKMPLRLEDQVGPSTEPTLWCAIYQVVGEHETNNCHLLQKFVQTPQQVFYNFCKSVGHKECNCRSYELMMERIPAYQMLTKT